MEEKKKNDKERTYKNHICALSPAIGFFWAQSTKNKSQHILHCELPKTVAFSPQKYVRCECIMCLFKKVTGKCK